MSFTDAVTFLAAILAIIAAGAFLGSSLRGRSQRRQEQLNAVHSRKYDLYVEIIGALDSLTNASDRQKQWFIHRYYQSLMVAPDAIVTPLNRYLDNLTAEDNSNHDKLMEMRGQLVMAMRQDILSSVDMKTTLSVPELYKIEVRTDDYEPTESPAPITADTSA